MKAIVVDASVAIKWFIPEIHATAAGRLLEKNLKLLAPDLIFAEIGNILWKKCRLNSTIKFFDPIGQTDYSSAFKEC